MSDADSQLQAPRSPLEGDDTVSLTEEQIQHRVTQVQYGKNTEGYKRWQMLSSFDPVLAETVVAPDPFDPVSKRRFDGRVKKWRRDLHKFDPQTDEQKQEVEDWTLQQNVFLTNVYSLHDFFQNESYITK
ncbi:hypothetical protein WA538_004109, partial [Blastocystis sp. DL]